MDRITAIAKSHKITIVEDCAHMHGGFWSGHGAGSIGQIGSFSFQQSKTMSAGEGGICLTNDDALADRLYRFKHIGYSRGTAQGKAQAGPPADLQCHNYRCTAFQAVLLRQQLPGLNQIIAHYEKSAAILKAMLADVDGVRIQSRGAQTTQQGYYGLVFLFDRAPLQEIPLSTLMKAMDAEGMCCGGTYGPVYRHQLYNSAADKFRIAEGGCPVTETIGTDRAVSIPHYMLSNPEEKIRQIGEIIRKVARNVAELKKVPVAAQ